MATASPPAGQPAAERVPFGVRLHRFWRRVTEGLEVSQLWSQFESEARTSYRLYSRDVEAKTPEGLTRRGRRLHVIKEFFWAVFEKLSPADAEINFKNPSLLYVQYGTSIMYLYRCTLAFHRFRAHEQHKVPPVRWVCEILAGMHHVALVTSQLAGSQS
jgi:hypothetical protein